MFPDCVCVDIYDNSSGHNCKAVDALDVDELNINPGGINHFTMRCGWYLVGGVQVSQCMHFGEGDVLQVPVSVETGVSTEHGKFKTREDHMVGEIITGSHELLGVAKGLKQLAIERQVAFSAGGCKKKKHATQVSKDRTTAREAWMNDVNNVALLEAYLPISSKAEVAEECGDIECSCVSCTMRNQPDFVGQLSGLEEVYNKHNSEFGKAHKCIFLPKFHPELNAIERCWSKMKNHVRAVNDGSLPRLREAMEDGLAETNLSVATIRRYCRLVECYYEAYEGGKDIIQAQEWINAHRSHRSHNKTMDSALERIYFPLGRPPTSSETLSIAPG